MPSYDQDKYPPSNIVLVVLQAIRRSSRVNISKSVISFMICFKQKDKEEREVNTSTSLGFLVAINYRLGFSGKKESALVLITMGFMCGGVAQLT